MGSQAKFQKEILIPIYWNTNQNWEALESTQERVTRIY